MSVPTGTTAGKYFVISQCCQHHFHFSSIHNFIVTICQFSEINWVRCSSFYRMTAVQDYPECGLSHMSLSPLLTVQLCSHSWFDLNKHQWMSMGIIFFLMEEFVFSYQMPFCHSVVTKQNISENTQLLLPYCQTSNSVDV